jgi:hypothetical protein
LDDRRRSLEQEYDNYLEKHSNDMTKLESNIKSMIGQMKQLDTLTKVATKCSREFDRAEYDSMQTKLFQLQHELEASQDTRDNATLSSLKMLSTEELQSYRNKFHHMRRLATEQQAHLVAEKTALLEQIEEMTSRKGSTNHARAIAEHFGKQLGVAEEARRAEREADGNEISGLRVALSQERERSEKRARQHARELAVQMKMSKERQEAEELMMKHERDVEEHMLSSIQKIDTKTSRDDER